MPPTLGLSMIVKNGGKDLRPCLESVRSIVDQIVIADTGSTDDTVSIASEFGAIIVSHPWQDHYAEARNAALAPITTDWVLVLDADEELSSEAARELPRLLQNTSAEIGGYRLSIRNYVKTRFTSVLGTLSRDNHDDVERAKAAPAYADHRLCRLFRRHPGIYYHCRVHEVVEHQVAGAGFRLAESDLRILHFGHLAETAGYQGKYDYYRRILKQAVAETPDYPHLWLQLAIVEKEFFANPEEAVTCAQKAIALRPTEYEAWSLIGTIRKTQNQHADAIDAFQHLPDTGDYGVIKARALGDLFHDTMCFDTRNFKEARAMYLAAQQRMAKSQTPFSLGLVAETESKLGYVEVQIGMRKVGFRKLRHAVEMSPEVLDNHNRLVKACVLAGDDEGAADAAEATLEHFLSDKLFARASALRLKLRQMEESKKLLEAGLRFFPESESLRRMQA
jgi:glycosyltransferase involved in cell wall biosynthesis